MEAFKKISTLLALQSTVYKSKKLHKDVIHLKSPSCYAIQNYRNNLQLGSYSLYIPTKYQSGLVKLKLLNYNYLYRLCFIWDESTLFIIWKIISKFIWNIIQRYHDKLTSNRVFTKKNLKNMKHYTIDEWVCVK